MNRGGGYSVASRRNLATSVLAEDLRGRCEDLRGRCEDLRGQSSGGVSGGKAPLAQEI